MLADTEESNFFKLKAVQRLIEFNYPLAREYLIKKLFLPFTVFNLVFFIVMNYVYENRHIEFYDDLLLPCMLIIVAFATYFLMNEVH